MKNNIESIKTERLLLRSINETDLENIFHGLSHPEVIRYYGISFDSLEATKLQMDWYAQPEQCWWAICSVDNAIFYGAAGLNSINAKHKKAEIGLWLLPEFWGRGIMTEVMPLVCNYGFNKLGLHRVEGFVETGNQACKRALDKLKFSYEGTMVECEIKDGASISIDIYALLQGK